MKRLMPLLLILCLVFSIVGTAFAVANDAGLSFNGAEPSPNEESGVEEALFTSAQKASAALLADKTVKSNVALASNGGKMHLGEKTVQNSGLTVLNNGLTSHSSGHWNDFDNRSGYPYYNNGYNSDARICVTFKSAFTVDELRLFLIYETAAAAGCKLPARITVQYWDESKGEFVDVKGQSSDTGFIGNVYNGSTFNPDFITFEPVKTTKIQLVVKHGDTNGKTNNAAVWFTEIEAYTFDSMDEEEDEVLELPPQAAMVYGVDKPVIDLNGAKGTDEGWKFLFETNIAGIPLPTAAAQDFDPAVLNGKGWNDVVVPGCILMQGFDIENNTEYYYQRQVHIPADYAGHRVIIRFDAVYTNTRVWIDGRYVRTHKGGFTAWDCDITDFVTPGQSVTLTVGFADIHGTNKGTWNQTGEYMSDPSWASSYVQFNMGGITRDVSLMALPRDYLVRAYIDTTFTDTTFTDAKLRIRSQLHMESPEAKLRFELLDKDGNTVASRQVDFDSAGGGVLSRMSDITIPVTAPLKWDAEHPNLYTLRTILSVGGADKEVSEQKIGFRQLDYGGSFGDVNKVYINGKEIKLRGVNRHDVSAMGRSTTRELDYQEILAYKKANINFIRTSHYQVSKHLLDACDELGMYVEHENAACFQQNTAAAPPEDFINQFQEMVERDRNRASIIIWSLANESYWSSTSAFQTTYNFIREVDPSRPVMYSYPNTAPITFSIFSQHYDWWGSSNLGRPNIPVLHDEYSPSAVHNKFELKRDLNVRNFYGESTRRFWENVFMSDGALGGAHWASIDDVFHIPVGTTQRWIRDGQGQAEGSAVAYGQWGVVLDAFRRDKPEAYHTLKGYSPVRIDEKNFYITGNTLSIPIKNWFDHTNFSELLITCSVDGTAATEIAPPDIEPHKNGVLAIEGSWDAAKQVNLKFYTRHDGIMVDEFNINLVETKYLYTPASTQAPAIDDGDEFITVSGENFSVVFDKQKALIQKADFKGDVLITGGPYLNAPLDLGAWTPAASGAISAETEGNLAVVTLKGAYEYGPGVTFVVSISGNGMITSEYTLTSTPEKTANLNEVGVSYDIPSDIESVSWIRNGFHSAYPEGHTGRTEGTAKKVRDNYQANPDVYSAETPAWGWEDDMRDFFLYADDDPNDGIVTNDFKTMRENIWHYDVNFNGTGSRISVESDGSDAARVEVTSDWELIDDRDPRVKYTNGTWSNANNQIASGLDMDGVANYAYNRTEKVSSSNNAACELDFVGTGVSFISSKLSGNGSADVYIDDRPAVRIDTWCATGQSKKRVVYSINGLEYGAHTIKVVRVDRNLRIDGFAVLTKEATDPSAQASRLIINQQWYYPAMQWGAYQGVPGTLSNGSTGSAAIRLTDTDNLIPVEKKAEYIPVTDITDIPRIAGAGTDVPLSATVTPDDATSRKDITWSLKDAGTTGATIAGSVLKTTAAGIVVVTATIGNFTKDFSIWIRKNVALSSNGGVMYKTAETYEERNNISLLNNGAIGRGSGYWSDWKSNYSYANQPVIGVKLGAEYLVDAVALYVMNDGGGCYPPEKITVQYWNGSEYVNVSNQSPVTGFKGNYDASEGNLIVFDPVRTTDVRLLIEHGKNEQGEIRALALTEYAVYLCDETGFVPVSDVTGIPATAMEGTSLFLAGVVTPSDATNKSIVWRIKDAGETGAALAGNEISFDSVGTAVITATITNGAAPSVDFVRDFSIKVTKTDARIISVSYPTAVSCLVSGYAANLPVTVTSENADDKTIAVVFKDAEGNVLAGPVIVEEGKALLKVSAYALEGFAYITAYVVGEENICADAAIEYVIPASNIWAPTAIDNLDGTITVAFGEELSLTAKAGAVLNGTGAAYQLGGDSRSLIITGALNEGEDTLVISGVKYPKLFPSYSFTFTLKA